MNDRAVAPAPDLPRRQSGAMPQHLLLTLFGDYWMGSEAALPSAALVALLQEFDVSATSARAAIVRLAQRGVLQGSKQGRQTFYRLAPEVVSGGLVSRPRLLRFGSPEHAEEWDGTWIMLTFTIRLEQSHVRRPLRARLRSLGFASLQDSVWITASTKQNETAELLADFPGVDAVVVHGAVIHPTTNGTLDALAIWPLADVRADYERFIHRFEPIRESALRGMINSSDALTLRTEIMDRWRGLFRSDPNLPTALLPQDWPRPRARQILVDCYDALGPLAEHRCQQILNQYANGSAPAARHYTIASYLAEPAVAR